MCNTGNVASGPVNKIGVDVESDPELHFSAFSTLIGQVFFCSSGKKNRDLPLINVSKIKDWRSQHIIGHIYYILLHKKSP